MKTAKLLTALFSLALLAGCAGQQCCDDTTGSEGQAKSGACCGDKSQASKACCDTAKADAKAEPAAPAKK